jgi:hypothetical protein
MHGATIKVIKIKETVVVECFLGGLRETTGRLPS